MTRTASGSSPNTPDTACRTGCTPWVESHRVSAPSADRAVVVCDSSGFWWYIAVV